MNTNGNYYVNRLRRRESFKRLINIGLSAICLFLEIALFAYMWQFHFQFQLVDPLQKIWYRGFLLENCIYSDLRWNASGLYEKYGDHIFPGVCNTDGGCTDLCRAVYDGA